MNTKFVTLLLLLVASFSSRALAQEQAVKSSAVVTINVLGAVEKPSRFTLPADATLLDALAAAGGTARLGDPTRTKVIHKTSIEKPDVAVINVTLILDGTTKDLALHDGDTLYVPERMF